MSAAMGSPGGIAAVAERYLRAVVSRGELDAIDELFDPGHVMHHPAMPDLPDGPRGVREMVERQRRVYPDLVFRVDETLQAGDRVAVRGMMGGTGTGSLLGLPPTGRTIMVAAVYWFRFTGSRIAETWVVIDRLQSAMQQGLVVAPDPSATDPGWT
ncbi:MAG: ester cyclase [Thermoleophilia bacterium]|nr:ester cyclase [Thermoleophilia bacterium]